MILAGGLGNAPRKIVVSCGLIRRLRPDGFGLLLHNWAVGNRSAKERFEELMRQAAIDRGKRCFDRRKRGTGVARRGIRLIVKAVTNLVELYEADSREWIVPISHVLELARCGHDRT